MLAKWPMVGRGFEALVRAGLVRQGTVGEPGSERAIFAKPARA